MREVNDFRIRLVPLSGDEQKLLARICCFGLRFGMRRLFPLELRSEIRQILLESVDSGEVAILGNTLFELREAVECRRERASDDGKALVERATNVA